MNNHSEVLASLEDSVLESATLSVVGEFHNPDLEREFRDFDFKEMKYRICGFAAMVFIALIVSMVVELLSRDWSGPNFAEIQYTRCFVLIWIAASAVMFLYLKTPKALYSFGFLIALGLGLVAIRIPMLRPPNYMGHYMFNMMFLVSYYVLFPIPFRLQIIPPLLVSCFDIGFLLLYKKPMDPQYYPVITSAILVANMLGFFIAIQASLANRKRFLEYKKERVLAQKLQSTLDKLEVAERFVPICCHCKRIRRDDDFWEELETFVQRAPEFQFSHGICPTCMNTYYPDVVSTNLSEKRP
jgi:hypothetical protein